VTDDGLGVGVMYTPALEPFLEARPDLAPVLELEPETLWTETGTAEFIVDREALERVRRLPQRKLVHGVGFPVGGTRLPDRRHIEPLRETIEILESPWASEHLGFNEAELEGRRLFPGFLLPPRQTLAGVEAAAETIGVVAADLPVPFAVETGVSYLRPRRDELSDGAFVAAVAGRADCGILLDLHNLWVNERNGRQPVDEFLAELPLDRVWEMHVAGGLELDGFYLDAHSGEIPRELLALAASVVPRLTNLRAIVYELTPETVPRLGLAGVEEQLELLQELWEVHDAQPSARPTELSSQPVLVDDPGPTPREWEDELGRQVAGFPPTGAFGEELARDPGVAMLRRLAEEVRAGMVTDCLPLTSRLLVLTLGRERFRQLLERYWRSSSPALFGITEADGFARFLAQEQPQIPFLTEVLGYEHALLRARRERARSTVRFRHDPAELLSALAAGEMPDLPEIDECLVVVDASTATEEAHAPAWA
jgi:uncharacterized protein (UPF0276 family)